MTSTREFVPAGADLDRLREAAAGCRGCELYENATQTVFGRGDANARVVMVGEQPGDKEDQRGLPFVGPGRAPAAPCCRRRRSGSVPFVPH